jgi:hypothetical protein
MCQNSIGLINRGELETSGKKDFVQGWGIFQMAWGDTTLEQKCLRDVFTWSKGCAGAVGNAVNQEFRHPQISQYSAICCIEVTTNAATW